MRQFPRVALWISVALLSGFSSSELRAEQASATAAPDRVKMPRPFGVWDYSATALALGFYYWVEFTFDGPRGAEWNEPVPVIDEPVRDFLALESRPARRQADLVSDYFWYSSVAYSMLMPAAAAALTHQKVESRLRLLKDTELINIQAYAVASLLTRIPHKFIGRTRPDVIGCRQDPTYHPGCDTPGEFVSFPGGHTAISATGAGLACAHHMHGRLLGDPWDALGCSLALAGAAGVFVTRIQADRHWLSDNLVGTGFGLLSGYLIPTWLYYHPFWEDDPAAMAERRASWILAPAVDDSELGAQVVGEF